MVTPAGYMRARDAINAVGLELYPADWTGDEDKVPVLYLAPGQTIPSGSGSGGNPGGESFVVKPHSSVDSAKYEPARIPDTEEYRRYYQANVAARQRWNNVVVELVRRLEGGKLLGAILDPWTGAIHRLSDSFWRRTGVKRMVEAGQAPIEKRYSSQLGTLLIEAFQPKAAKAPKRKLTRSEFDNAQQQLKASPDLTRPEQYKLILDKYPHMTDRQWREILKVVGSRSPGKKRRPR
jgi:hypothetical protein